MADKPTPTDGATPRATGGFSDAFDSGGFDTGARVTRLRAPVHITEEVVISEGGPTPTREAALAQLRGLISAFKEVDEYDPQRHHNGPRPALWIGSEDYLQDVRQLVQELRRLNELLEAEKPPAPETLQRSGVSVAAKAEKIVDSACDVIGKGLGVVILVSLGTVLIQLGIAPEVGLSLIRGGK